jgi:hypothetical protein
MLTLRQTLTIATRRSAPPWHAGELLTILKLQGTFSLKSAINKVQAQKVVLFVQIRDSSILESVSTLAELNAIWKSSHPGQNTVSLLSKILAPSGAFIGAISSDGQTVGIAGTTLSLVGVPIKLLVAQATGGIGIAGGMGMGVGIALGILGLPEDTPVLIGLALSAAGGGATGYVLSEGSMSLSTDAGQGVAPTTVVPIGQGNVIEFGPTPSGLSAQDAAGWVTDLGDVENWPTDPVTDLGDVENWPTAAVTNLGDVENWPTAAGSGPPVVDVPDPPEEPGP